MILYTTEVTDEALHAEYRSRVAALLEAEGGKFVARGSVVEASDGETAVQRRIAVMEFPTVEQARAWIGPQSEPEHAAVRELRERASNSISFVIEGT
ncbi:MAG: DUF1330 domain-containing protein [Chloroflexi bacterium]|nr:DUF1330 domain-containing protein [Chloroflexota bacterium]